MTHGRILVAGIGNIFLGDDAFGVEVVGRLRDLVSDERVIVGDFGIRGLDLAFALQDGYDALVLVDAASQGGAPGTLYVIEPDVPAEPPWAPLMDTHSLLPHAVLGMSKNLGVCPRRVYVVGCEPSSLEPARELSPAVAAAVGLAVERIRQLVAELLHPDERSEERG
jgi:hydrogenase maturation protease